MIKAYKVTLKSATSIGPLEKAIVLAASLEAASTKAVKKYARIYSDQVDVRVVSAEELDGEVVR